MWLLVMKVHSLTADFHIAPGLLLMKTITVDSSTCCPQVLPPKINCTCQAAMDAYASLLSVVSKTPTPGAPVTLDPEVLNTGTSKIVATLRMYQDPTYSIPASSIAALPIVVTRFYLEVSTKFTRNRITISDCQASNLENLLNDTTSLKPRMNYCDNSTFDSRSEVGWANESRRWSCLCSSWTRQHDRVKEKPRKISENSAASSGCKNLVEHEDIDVPTRMLTE